MWKAKAEYDLKNHPEWNVEGDKEEDDDIDLVLGVENEYTQSMANTEKDKSHEPKLWNWMPTKNQVKRNPTKSLHHLLLLLKLLLKLQSLLTLM